MVNLSTAEKIFPHHLMETFSEPNESNSLMFEGKHNKQLTQVTPNLEFLTQQFLKHQSMI